MGIGGGPAALKGGHRIEAPDQAEGQAEDLVGTEVDGSSHARQQWQRCQQRLEQGEQPGTGLGQAHDQRQHHQGQGQGAKTANHGPTIQPDQIAEPGPALVEG